MSIYFSEHGDYSLALVSENVLLLEATGPWNAEIFNRYDNELREMVSLFNGQAWQHIALLKNETVLIPEVENMLL